nr:hypothetical protein [Tanacetum cinerariifolium]
AGEGAGTSSMSSFTWILRKILPATSEYTRPELDVALAGVDWPPIIKEEEMS